MDAYIRNLHRDGVPKEEEEQPKEIKDSEGKYKKTFWPFVIWLVISGHPRFSGGKMGPNIPGGMHFHAYSGF